MHLVLGLDVSTSCVGVCIVDAHVEPDEKGSNVILMTHIDFKKCKTLWEKADVTGKFLANIPTDVQVLLATAGHPFVMNVCVEEPLMGFRTGMSSAATITTLMKFNGIVSYLSRKVFNVDPEYISASHARKQCGVKVQRVSKCGKSGKEQVFEHMCQNDLKHVKWPFKKRSVKVVDWARDETDAYVIARAGALQHMHDFKLNKP